jgi:hypothetical protein
MQSMQCWLMESGKRFHNKIWWTVLYWSRVWYASLVCKMDEHAFLYYSIASLSCRPTTGCVCVQCYLTQLYVRQLSGSQHGTTQMYILLWIQSQTDRIICSLSIPTETKLFMRVLSGFKPKLTRFYVVLQNPNTTQRAPTGAPKMAGGCHNMS